MRAAEYFSPHGLLGRSIPSWEHRPGQGEMAEAVQNVLDNDGVSLVEAGTGTGKTFAYLVPALLADRRVVVSTGTRTLQDQIMARDLPLLQKVLGLAVPVCALKGLPNYLCQRRHHELRTSPESLAGPVAEQLPVIDAWSAETQAGDWAEVSGLEETAPIWREVLSSSETRVGARCDFYETCFVTRLKRKAESSQVLVVNHHLFFADLAARQSLQGGVLPDYDAVILDEAHRIEEIATHFFGVRVSSSRVQAMVRDCRRALETLESDPASLSVLDHASATAESLFRTLAAAWPDESVRIAVTEPWSGEGDAAYQRLDAALEALAACTKRRAVDHGSFGQLTKRCTQLRTDLATIAEHRPGDHVMWVERKRDRVALTASPVDVRTILRDHLFHRTPAIVLTSATLTTAGRFDFMERRLGIDFDVDRHAFPSPFDYESQCGLYVPGDFPDPRDPAHLERTIAACHDLIRLSEGGAFILCTSLRMVRRLAVDLVPQLRQAVLIQGEGPKRRLIERFQADGNAVLIGTASFWEGVDVPGEPLRLVIMDKIPFAVPTDPLQRARAERIREAGGNPFVELHVPAAALALKQGFGRLVRSKNDRGVVAILDSRVLRRGYGRHLLASLPQTTRCHTLEDVASFLTRTNSSSSPRR